MGRRFDRRTEVEEILAACVTGTKVDNEALPFMGHRHGEISGAPVMICRLSFSGELAYEVYSGAGQRHACLRGADRGSSRSACAGGKRACEKRWAPCTEKGHVTGAETRRAA